MKSAPLSLDASYPTLIHVVNDPEGSSDASYDVECDIQVAQNATNERRWRVELGVKFKGKGTAAAAHRGEVTYVGIFTVVDECPNEKMYRLIGVDAPSILYSSVRELVALLTGRGSTRIVFLPTVSFIENVVVPPTKDEKEPAGSPAPTDAAKDKNVSAKAARSNKSATGNARSDV